MRSLGPGGCSFGHGHTLQFSLHHWFSLSGGISGFLSFSVMSGLSVSAAVSPFTHFSSPIAPFCYSWKKEKWHVVWEMVGLGGVGFNVTATIIFGIKDSKNIQVSNPWPYHSYLFMFKTHAATQSMSWLIQIDSVDCEHCNLNAESAYFCVLGCMLTDVLGCL